jgi:hypothetical protein
MNFFKLIIISLLSLSVGFYAAKTSADSVNYYKDIRPIIEQRCLSCHTESGVSFSFEDPELTYMFKDAIVPAVVESRMPPWLAESGHQSYVGDESLTDKQKRLFASWKAAGFSKGKPSEFKPLPKIDNQHVFRSDYATNFLPNRSFLPNQKTKDDYRCFVVEWPYKTKKFVTGFKASPGNLKVAHHIVVHHSTAKSAELFRAIKSTDGREGYQCFGSAFPDQLADKESRAKFEETFKDGAKRMNNEQFWLAHWAPGMDGYSFPENTGIPIEPGSVVIVQMHYYSGFAPGEKDANSEIAFQIADSVEKPSLNFPLTEGQWLMSRRNKSMTIARGEQASYRTSVNFKRIAKYASRALNTPYESIEKLELHTANLHMHAFGSSAKATLQESSGRIQTLLNIPRWDLDWQRDFTFTHPKIVTPKNFEKTLLAVECTFKNHTNEVVLGGFSSDEEMCFNFSYLSISKSK